MASVVRIFLLVFLSAVNAQKPNGFNITRGDRSILAAWLLGQNIRETHAEFPGYDGWYNNLARPDSGAIDRPLLRRWPAAYEDGTYKPVKNNRPNPITLSDRLLAGSVGTRSKTGKNALLVFFGQQVVEEILDSQRAACPPEYFNIEIPIGHKYRAHHTVMPLLRTRFDQRTGLNPNNPRQQLNEITPYIDGGLVYGITKQWADQLRTYANGTIDPDGLLAYSHGGLFPEYNTHRLPLANPPPPFHHAQFIENHEIFNVSRFFKLGNPRGNENTFLLTFGVLWFRWHNYLARYIRSRESNWSSEKVYNEARKWVIATQQHIIMDEWLPSWITLRNIPRYTKYDPSIDPQIDQFFQSAAFRFGHTLVTPGVYLRDYSRNNCGTDFSNFIGTNAVRTCNAFWRPQDAIKSLINREEFVDIDRVLMGMAVQMSEREDHEIVNDLRGDVFGPLEFPRRDLMAINIQRARDHGIPDFNSARRAYNLPPINSSAHFRFTNDSIRETLEDLYQGNFDNIDVWVGGILETNEGPGELFETIIIDQFRRIRDGDRFWYENRANRLFTEQEIRRIKDLTLYDIIMAVTKMDSIDIQPNVFRVPGVDIPECNLVQSECTERGNNRTCFHLPLLTPAVLNETCREGSTYDYFKNSEVSFILTFIFLSAIIAGMLGFIYTVIYMKTTESKALPTMNENNQHEDRGDIIAMEWISPKQRPKPVTLTLNRENRTILVFTANKTFSRKIDCQNDLEVIMVNKDPYIIIKPLHSHDLVLLFESLNLRNTSYNKFKDFISDVGLVYKRMISDTWKDAQPKVITQEMRLKHLEVFFRVVMAQTFSISHKKEELLRDDISVLNIMKMEITREEFAALLNMTPDNKFVSLMFQLIDADKNGFVSFKEFTDLNYVFATGTANEKAQFLFNMYNIDGKPYITIDTFKEFIGAFMENRGGYIRDEALQQAVESMLSNAGLGHKTELNFEDFLRLFDDDSLDHLGTARLRLKFGATDTEQFVKKRKSIIEKIYGTIDEVDHQRIQEDRQEVTKDETISFIKNIFKQIEKNSIEVFWKILYTLVLLAIFAERAYYYSVEREHSGLRRIAGYGVTVTRGAASAMMFTYSSLLVTMCRNLNTFLRDTFATKYYPFDATVDIHKYIANWALLFTVMHIIGHGFNFYHISTQTADDLTCLFRNYFHSTHELPKFHYWCWQTMTGFTGVILTLITAVIYVFAQPIVREKLYSAFWITHSLYPLFYIFMILHGSGRLIQEPFFYYFFLGPVILFAIDQVISISRKKVQFIVAEARILPSSVTMLKILKPDNFTYKSGQWVRIACLDLNSHEYHPFTLSTAPHEPYLSVHIRAVGPWTRHIRDLYENANENGTIPLPKIYLDGPFGEGHQNWNKYEVSILIASGIGVTPFASILKDIAYITSINQQSVCKRVYFIWISRNHKQFEWFTDMLLEVEQKDLNKIIQTHIFITESYSKHDIRTIMLYLCERHYEKIAKRSIFTDLSAETHFERPDFYKLLQRLSNLQDCTKIGVFSCGGPTMIRSVEDACIKFNKDQFYITMEHHSGF